MLPEIPGLQTVNYLTLTDLSSANLGQDSSAGSQQFRQQLTAQSWLVMGNPYQGAEISQMLQRSGKTVTLISPKVQLLPQEEPIANYLIQGQLEAQGIRLLTDSPVKLIRQIDGQQWVQAGDRAIETTQILLCSQQTPNTQGLNLEAVGVQTTKTGTVTNQYLQTTNPHIYAYNQPYTATSAQQMQTVIKNILISPLFPISNQVIKLMYTQPRLARSGMTEYEARQRYGKRVITLREYVKAQPLAQIQEDLTGFCQLVVLNNGVILGATIVGSQAMELISLVALAMRSHLRVADLAQLPEVHGSLLQRTAAQWLDRQSKFYHLWQELKNKFRGEESS
ncbi:MAG: FAD-dependent oxidoreductase [Coleofasciculaceae cyanobacterium SM2_1_6]|nr:FAD-dependent oxidoreductase [Coleofasciculaceae cyanobacterium SM2_1_6]